MKSRIILALVTIVLAAVPLVAQKLDTSEQEMERLKKLNKSKTFVSQTDQELAKIMVGKWSTGRHEYLYKADGTWRMLPEDISTTNGKWQIRNKQLIEQVQSGSGLEPTGARTFLEVTRKQLVLKNEAGPYPFRYLRIE